MALLSAEANLGRRYTNHSIRSTVMGILGDEFEGHIVIGWSGHKSEQTIKQYVCNIPVATKREICQKLAQPILPKKPKMSEPTATVSKPPDNEAEDIIEVQLDPPQNENLPVQPQENLEFQLQLLDDAPPDEQLINFLNQFEEANLQQENQQVPKPQPPTEAPEAIPLQQIQNHQKNVAMNIKNIQNVNPMQMVPAMLFPHSNVTINCNFGPKQ